MERVTPASKSLEDLAKEYWQARLREDPLMATSFGDRRYDDRLQDITPAGRARREEEYESVIARCESIDETALQDRDRLARDSLLVDAKSMLEYASCLLEEWTVDPLNGPQVELQNVESYQPVRSVEEARAMVKRWRAMGPYLDEHMANLRRGKEKGMVGVRICVEKALEEIDDLMSKPVAEWPLLRPASEEHPDWSEGELSEFRQGLAAAVSESVRPALGRYRDFLRSEVLGSSRPQERPGIGQLSGGLAAYSRLIVVHTSLDLAPDALHQTGLAEVARINGELEVLGEKVFGVRERPAILKRLRTDPSLYFSTRDEVAAKAESALAKSRAAIPRWFGRLPKTPCEVVLMEEHEERNSTIAYYRPPAPDGSRPGRYYINTSAPETRPRYEAEALAYHESIPGHHLQIAIAQELEGVPDFMKYSGVTAFIEGWGLYTERLAVEMGLYSSDIDRIGVLSYDAWRACRLVVDTGMHARGWSRAQAIDFMLRNTALAENNIVNEVDRYISWPGQALAYKTGQLEILRLRREAEGRLGKGFDIREFHDVILGNGGIPLKALRGVVERYLKGRSQSRQAP